jgi:amino acid transporter
VAHAELRRDLGTVSAIAITVGGVIGSGIFLKPLDISRALPTPEWIFGVWAVIGLLCLCGALAYAELGAMLPEAGGMYAFIREAWGRFPAFLYGWCLMLVTSTGAVAALSIAFASSLATMVPMGANAQIAVAVVMILTLAVVNHVGVRWGALLQNLSTFAKLSSLLGIVFAGFVIYRGVSASGGGEAASVAPPGAVLTPPSLLSGLIVASVAIFWAYEGWYALPFNAAELKRPERDLPRGLIWGVFILIAVYTTVNAAYLHVVPLDEMRAMASEPEVPKTVIARAFGTGAGEWLAIFICISTLGAANPALLSNARCFYAMARDGMAFPSMMRVHAVFGTPTVAIWAQAIWASILVVVLKTFRDITEYVVFVGLIFYALAVAAVYALRRSRPAAPRPYRCFGYPLTPAIFIAAVAFVDVYTLLDPRMRINALYGIGILIVGAVVYFTTGLNRRGRSTELDRAA